jgi:hypothetical protein
MASKTALIAEIVRNAFTEARRNHRCLLCDRHQDDPCPGCQRAAQHYAQAEAAEQHAPLFRAIRKSRR